MATIRYLRELQPAAVFYRAPIDGRRPGQGADGYGRKIATDYAARYGGRTRRVYCCIFSNAGSLYVVDHGERLYVGDFDMDDPAPLPPECRGGLTASR
jgi:hypothetical protein